MNDLGDVDECDVGNAASEDLGGTVNGSRANDGGDHVQHQGMLREALALAMHILRTEGPAGMYVGLEAQLWQAAAKEAILNTVRRGLGST